MRGLENMRHSWKRVTISAAILAILGMQPIAFGQEVTSVGMGVDRSSALKDAQRNAVQQVIGTYIDSQTLVSDAVVVLDEIYAKTHGFAALVDVLEEGTIGDSYRIKARIQVDTAPNSELLQKINLMRALNDPRISVVVTYHGDASDGEKAAYCESIINEMLLNQGFSHVVEPKLIRDEQGNVNFSSNAVDYLVIGELTDQSSPILLPKYADYTDENSAPPGVQTNLSKALATMDAKIVKTDTQEIIGSFRVTGDGIRDTDSNAARYALKALAPKAAEAVRKALARQGSSINGSVQIIVRTDSSQLPRLEQALRKLADVHELTLRSYENGKGIIHVETDLKPSQLFRRLQDSGLTLLMEKASANTLEISM